MDKESNNYKKLKCYLTVLIRVFSNQISIHHCINIWDKCISGKVLLSINEEIRNIYFHLFTCMNFYINHGYPPLSLSPTVSFSYLLAVDLGS